MADDGLHGAWRIEESPIRKETSHPYGFPNTHWVILGDRGVVVRDAVQEPLAFDFSFRLDNSVTPNEIRIGGHHGGVGYYDLDDPFLFIGLGFDCCRPPRFANDCGSFFAFIRDDSFDLPSVPQWPRTDIECKDLGRLVWDAREPVFLGQWRGEVVLADGTPCDILASDYLIPIERFLDKIESVYGWLVEGLPEVKLVCSEGVAEWVCEDDDYRQLSIADIADTISVNAIYASDGDIELWAATSIPIDHSIRVYLDINDTTIRATGSSIEG